MKEIKKFHQAFVSSTYVDLIEERQMVMQTLLKMNCMPVGMELFPNGDADVWKLIERLIDDCDIYILIVAGRCGTISPNGKSFTRKEYEYAEKKKKPILVFPHANPETHKPDCAKENSIQKEALKKFQNKIWRRAVSPWKNIDELRANISIALADLKPELPGGWTRMPPDLLSNFSDEISALEKRFESAEINKLIKLLNETLQAFQFKQSNSRLSSLIDMLPWLNKSEWELLTSFAQAQLAIRPEWLPSNSTPRAIKPIRQAVTRMVNHYNNQLKNFENNILEIEGELIEKVSVDFMQAVQKSFRALSYDDFDFWAGDESDLYYETNRNLIDRGVNVERVFICAKSKFKEKTVSKVIKRQISDGIKVRIISSEVVERIIRRRLDRDFGLHDDFAVTFFRNYYGRTFKVDTNHKEIGKFIDIYEGISRSSEIIPGKSGVNNRIFESVDEFERWIEAMDN